MPQRCAVLCVCVCGCLVDRGADGAPDYPARPCRGLHKTGWHSRWWCAQPVFAFIRLEATEPNRAEAGARGTQWLCVCALAGSM